MKSKLVLMIASVSAVFVCSICLAIQHSLNPIDGILISNIDALAEIETDSEGLFRRKCVASPEQSSDPDDFVWDCLDCDKHFNKTGDDDNRCIKH